LSQGLTPPFLLAGVVLCLAGLAKLRSAAPAARAAREMGIPAGRWAVWTLAVTELAVGIAAVVSPGRLIAAACAFLYAFFTAVGVRLMRRRAGCGCFGEGDAPTSPVQVMLSGCFALVALASLVFAPHGVGWLLERPVAQWMVTAMALAGAAYGVVVAYTALPEAWTSWSGR
jgi:uncharacterized membrane protein YphA (DoxX/SURF4 family)